MSLKVIQFLNRSTTQIQVELSSDLDPGIGISNVAIRSTLENVPDLVIKAVVVTRSVLSIETSPQMPLVLYYLELVSSNAQTFKDINGEPIQENGQINRVYFAGLEKENDVRASLLDGLSPFFDKESPTFVRNYMSLLGDNLFHSRADMREMGNANYIKVDVIDELHTRGFGPTDRLNNEGAYEVLRVGINPTGATVRKTTAFNQTRGRALLANNYALTNSQIRSFPLSPVSLKAISVINERVSNAEVLINKFEESIVTLSKSNICQINSVVLEKENGGILTYDIPRFGYGLLDNRFDEVSAGQVPTLNSNQFKIADAPILNGDFDIPTGQDVLIVSYNYIDNGINISKDSIEITQVNEVIRERAPAFATTFFLSGFPIVSEADADLDLSGVDFADPSPTSGTPFVTEHPAFESEIIYSDSRLPSAPGEYSINYQTGQVFVYGEESANGTGIRPPVATYFYRKSFISGIDYTVDEDTDEIAALSTRDLIGEEVQLTYDYERVLAVGVDFEVETHNEIIDEYVDNRFVSEVQIRTKNYPITNVFQVLNETTGETYGTSRFTDNSIYLTGRALPRFSNIENEAANLSQVFFENIFASEILSSSGGSKIVKIEFLNRNILAKNGYGLGSNVNSSVVFSDEDTFLEEMFYDAAFQTVSENLQKLNTNGQYLVDYINGIAYLYTDEDTTDYGQVSYVLGIIATERNNIIAPDSVFYKSAVLDDVIKTVNFVEFDSTTITIDDMEPVAERFLLGDINKPIIVGAKQYGIAGQKTLNSNVFVALDAVFASGHADGNHIIRIPGESDRTITQFISMNTVVVDLAYTDNQKSVSWCLVDYDSSDGYSAITSYQIQSIRGIYKVEDLQANSFTNVTNLYDPESDSFDGNLITFNTNLEFDISAGDALVIDYDFGNLYVNYTHVIDNLRISYEYGDNSINHSLGEVLTQGQEYYVSYRYGALRENLLTNFGSLTQVDELTNFPLNFNRELYRDAISGAIASFIRGPTVDSISNIVSSITKVEPEIRELTFNEWTLSRDNIYLQPPTTTGEIVFGDGHFGRGLSLIDDNVVRLPSESYISLREGSMEGWIIPNWRGIDNDATLTFDIGQDGYTPDGYTSGLQVGRLDLVDVFIGSSAYNPSEMPFELHRSMIEPGPVTGRPFNYGEVPGYFIWFDEDENVWKVRWVNEINDGYTFTGQITSTGEIYRIEEGFDDGYDGYDGYFINEASDFITSSLSYIKFTADIDGYEASDGYVGGPSALLYADGFDFTSDNYHYIFDTGVSNSKNRLSLFKDGAGYINFRVRDAERKLYNISYDASDWLAAEEHQLACSWRFNTAEGIDEMHLFVDGQEVTNNFKFGGRLNADGMIYRTEAIEILSSNIPKNVIGNNDGSTTSGSNVFTSASGSFVSNGIIIGDTLTILDATNDAGTYTITGVTGTTLTLSVPLLLSLENVSYSVNQQVLSVETNIDSEKIAVYVTDSDDDRIELAGVNAEDPDYEIQVSGLDKYIKINKSVEAGDKIDVVTLGLIHGRVRETIFDYNSDHILRTNLIPPFDVSTISVFKYILKRMSIEVGASPVYGTGTFAIVGITSTITAGFTNTSQPSNSTDGKILKVTLIGDSNIDFSGTNEVTIDGTTFEGQVSETVTFSDYGTINTINHFRTITLLTVTATAFDTDKSFGAIEIRENTALTESENGGDYAYVERYDNGKFTFRIFGSGGMAFNLLPGHYLLDYITSLNIPMDGKGRLYLGTDMNEQNVLDGTLSELVFLNEMLMDVRTGEETNSTRTITSDYNSVVPLETDAQTLLLMHMNDNLNNIDTFYKGFDEEYSPSGRSVNSEFGNCAAFFNNNPMIIDNADSIIDNNQGTIEFWISPMIDILNDENSTRYYIDMSTLTNETVLSITAKSVILSRKARTIESVRLISDLGDGVNYFENGKLGLDGTTITLASPLPAQNTRVRVTFVPIDFTGDRLSIYKDGYGNLNFEINANEQIYQISNPIFWQRNSWHRVMASWDLNNLNNSDRMRLFIDGAEGGTLLYGSPGTKYGIGLVYGSVPIDGLTSNFLTTNIDMTDTFANIYVGNNTELSARCMARIDNLRFSNIVRTPGTLAGNAIDLNYTSNLETAFPVIEDNFTTALYDFSAEEAETDQLSNLLHETTPLFLFDVNVIDSFRRISGNDSAKRLIESLIRRLKPAHTNAYITFSE